MFFTFLPLAVSCKFHISINFIVSYTGLQKNGVVLSDFLDSLIQMLCYPKELRGSRELTPVCFDIVAETVELLYRAFQSFHIFEAHSSQIRSILILIFFTFFFVLW